MRILLLVEACGAGVGRHAIDLARSLSVAHDVHLVYSPSRADRTFLNGIAGLRTYALPMHRAPHPGDVAVSLRLRRYVRQHGPFDIFHAHSTKAGLLMRTALVGLPGARIYTPHAPLTMDPSLGILRRGILAAYERLLALWTDRIICVSQEELDHLHGLGVAREKLVLVANGIDGIRTYITSGKRPVCVGFLGRLAPQKNLTMLLAAFASLVAETKQTAVLAIAGVGVLEPLLRLEADRLGIASRVRWLGECDASVLQGFDIFALPSLYEGLPYVLLESLAAGLPIVATRVGGVSLLVDEGVNGFTVAVNDTAGFALALRQLLDDPDLRCRMGAAARERVANFTVSKMAEGILNVYRTSASRHRAPFGTPLVNILKSFHGRAD